MKGIARALLVAAVVVALLTPAADAFGIEGVIVKQPDTQVTLTSCELWKDGTIYVTSRSDEGTRGDPSLYFVRASFYDDHGKLLFEQLSTIYPGSWSAAGIASLYAPERKEVAAIRCAIDGKSVSISGSGGYTAYAGSLAKPCPNPFNSDVDGGADAYLDAFAIGKLGLELRLIATVNNFIPVGYSTFSHTPYFMVLDTGAPTYLYADGNSGQTLTFVRRELRPGFHRLVYGAGSVSSNDAKWTLCFTAS